MAYANKKNKKRDFCSRGTGTKQCCNLERKETKIWQTAPSSGHNLLRQFSMRNEWKIKYNEAIQVGDGRAGWSQQKDIVISSLSSLLSQGRQILKKKKTQKKPWSEFQWSQTRYSRTHDSRTELNIKKLGGLLLLKLAMKHFTGSSWWFIFSSWKEEPTVPSML